MFKHDITFPEVGMYIMMVECECPEVCCSLALKHKLHSDFSKYCSRGSNELG